MKETDLYIVKFSPHEILLSNGQTLKTDEEHPFDQSIVEDILDYNRRTRNDKKSGTI